jgi:hypothetical protein
MARTLELAMRCATLLVLSALTCAIRSAEIHPAGSGAVMIEPGLVVDPENHEISMDAAICLHRGIIEYLICRSGSFDHEALFSTRCRPSRLHAALLMIGGAPCPFLADVEWPALARERPAARVVVDVEYVENGAAKRQHAGRFLRNRERADHLAEGGWIFTGTPFLAYDGRERYAADVDGAVAGVSPKGGSVLQYGDLLGVPYQGQDQGQEIDETVTPTVGTHVRIIMSMHAQDAEK